MGAVIGSLEMEVALLTTLSVMVNVAGLHSWFTGLRRGSLVKQSLDKIQGVMHQVEKIIDRIFYIESLEP